MSVLGYNIEIYRSTGYTGYSGNHKKNVVIIYNDNKKKKNKINNYI